MKIHNDPRGFYLVAGSLFAGIMLYVLLRQQHDIQSLWIFAMTMVMLFVIEYWIRWR